MNDNAKIINGLIRKMVPYMLYPSDYLHTFQIPGIFKSSQIIKETFVQSTNIPCVLTKELIYKRLALIDLFYCYGVYKEREFGLEELTDVIWNLSETTDGDHTDYCLAKQLYCFTCAANPKRGMFWSIGIGNSAFCKLINHIFKQGFGHTIVENPDSGNSSVILPGGIEENIKWMTYNPTAENIMSVYMSYAASAYLKIENPFNKSLSKEDKPELKDNEWGFPIWDETVGNFLPKLEAFLGIKHEYVDNMKEEKKEYQVEDIVNYTYALKQVVEALKEEDSELWDFSNAEFAKSKLQKFQILDFFMRVVSKAGSDDYSKLLTKEEYETYIRYQKKVLPKRILDCKEVYKIIDFGDIEK